MAVSSREGAAPVLEAVELGRRERDGRLALDAVSLKVHPAEIYCLVGAPGSGTTMLVEAFAGLVAPTSGRALVDGVDAERYVRESGRALGLCSGRIRLFHELTALETWCYFARLRNGDPPTIEAAHQALREVRLPERAFGQRVGRFTPGMRIKLGLAIAVGAGGPALLLDGILSGVGPADAADLIEVLREHRDRGCAVLLTTRDVFRARQIGDRLAILNEGRKVLERQRSEIPSEDLDLLYESVLNDSDGNSGREW